MNKTNELPKKETLQKKDIKWYFLSHTHIIEFHHIWVRRISVIIWYKTFSCSMSFLLSRVLTKGQCFYDHDFHLKYKDVPTEDTGLKYRVFLNDLTALSQSVTAYSDISWKPSVLLQTKFMWETRNKQSMSFFPGDRFKQEGLCIHTAPTVLKTVQQWCPQASSPFMK